MRNDILIYLALAMFILYAIVLAPFAFIVSIFLSLWDTTKYCIERMKGA